MLQDRLLMRRHEITHTYILFFLYKNVIFHAKQIDVQHPAGLKPAGVMRLLCNYSV